MNAYQLAKPTKTVQKVIVVAMENAPTMLCARETRKMVTAAATALSAKASFALSRRTPVLSNSL